MQINIRLLLVLAIFSFQFVSAQITFQKTYSIQGDSHVYPTYNGDYVISSGSTLLKTNKFGDTIWTINVASVLFNNCSPTSDSGIIGIGGTTSFGSGDNDICVVRINSNGNILWSKTYGGTRFDNGYSIQQTSDSGFVFCGATQSYNVPNYDTSYINSYIIKTNANGDTLWTKSFGIIFGSDGSYHVKQTQDGSYIVVGWLAYLINYEVEIYLTKFSSSGDILWNRIMGGSNYEYGRYVEETLDSGFIILGDTWSFGIGFDDTYIIKTDSLGNVEWSHVIGTDMNDAGTMIQETSDGGFIFNSSKFQYDTSTIIKLNNLGDTLWTNSFAGKIYSVQETIDHGFIIGGLSYLGNGDMYLVKTDSNGISGCNEFYFQLTITYPTTIETLPSSIGSRSGTMVTNPILAISKGLITGSLCLNDAVVEKDKKLNSINVYPNPFSNYLHISMMEDLGTTQVSVFDFTGRLVKEFTITHTDNVVFDLDVLPGYYLIALQTNSSGSYFAKVLRQ
jgi:hypothetical protein